MRFMAIVSWFPAPMHPIDLICLRAVAGKLSRFQNIYVEISQVFPQKPYMRFMAIVSWFPASSEAGAYLRLIDSCITQLKAQGHSRTCNESKEVDLGAGPDEDVGMVVEDGRPMPRALCWSWGGELSYERGTPVHRQLA